MMRFSSMRINVEFQERNESIDVQYSITEILTGIGATDTDNGNVQLYAVRESTDDGDGNITL